MTRFARAKGSKSSNERVPDEATSWNEMKMQLEASQASSKIVAKKGKTAKELLAEKDEPFYHNTSGNVNHEWAAFDDISESKPGKEKGGKPQSIKSNKPDKKKIGKAAKIILSNDDSNNDQIVEVVGKTKDKKQNNDQVANDDKLESSQTIDKFQSKTKRRKKSLPGSSQLNSEKIVEQKDGIKNVDNPNSYFNSNHTLTEDKSDSKNKKRAKKSKESKSIENIEQTTDKSKNVTSESNPSGVIGLDSNNKESQSSNMEERLSKRQKRNQKKQRKILSEQNDSKVDIAIEDAKKEQTPKGFDVQGNDWSNEVKFGKQINPRQSSTTDGDNQAYKSKNLDKGKKKLSEKEVNIENKSDGNEVRNDNLKADDVKTENDNNTASKKNQKRKGGKNDNKEYKRRKPDEAVVKMIINGNEIEVVKYDGFPVKKEDADRLQELKKNMIIKGIPRSEINHAMKLERRKAEKALARERKRVCFHCRKSGHNLSDCPELGRDEAGSGICFKCGSAEHTHFECRVVKGQEFRHASCFICREQGHIARQCPDNPKGLYPQGGGCKICGDVTHLKKDCPDLIKEKEETNITADKIVGSQLESLEKDETVTKDKNDDNSAKSKIVKF